MFARPTVRSPVAANCTAWPCSASSNHEETDETRQQYDKTKGAPENNLPTSNTDEYEDDKSNLVELSGQLQGVAT